MSSGFVSASSDDVAASGTTVTVPVGTVPGLLPAALLPTITAVDDSQPEPMETLGIKFTNIDGALRESSFDALPRPAGVIYVFIQDNDDGE